MIGFVCSTVANVSLQALISSIDFFFCLVSASADKHGQYESRKQESENELLFYLRAFVTKRKLKLWFYL